MTVADNLKSQKVSTFPSARQRRAAKCMEWKVEQTWWKGNKSAANIYILFSLSRKLQERRYSTVHCTTAEQHMYHTLKRCPKPGNDWQNNNTQQWQDGICKHQTNVQVPSQPSMTKQPDHIRTWRIKHQPLVWPNDLYRLYILLCVCVCLLWTHTHHHIIFAGAAWLYFLSCDAKPAALRVHSALTTHRPGRQTQLWETPQQPVAVISAWRSAVGSAGSEDAKGGFVCRCVAFMDCWTSVDTDLQHGVTVCPASSPGHQDGATWFSSLTVSSDVLLHLPLVSISI